MLHSITRALLFLTAFTAPLTSLPSFHLGPFIFSPSKAVTAALLLWMPVVWLASRRPYPRDRKLVWLIAFTFSVAVSLATSFFEGVPAMTSVIVFTTYAAIALFYILIVYLVRDLSSLRVVFIGFVAGIALSSLSVLAGVGISELGRTGGYGGDPNHFSYDAAIGICFAIMIFLTSGLRILRGSALATIFLALAGILTSLSRSGFVTLLAIFGMWAIRFRQFRVLVFAVPAIAIAGAVVFAVSDDVRERMSTMTTSESREADGSITSRFVVGEYAIVAFVSNPITGVGFLRFGSWASEHIRSERQAARGTGGPRQGTGHVKAGGAIHNSYLHVAAEMGIIGLVPYFGFLLLTWFDFSYVWRLARRHLEDPAMRELYYMAMFSQIAFFGALVDNLFLSSLRYKSIWLLFGVATVLVGLARERAAQLGEEGSSPLENRDPVMGLPGLGDPEPLLPSRRL